MHTNNAKRVPPQFRVQAPFSKGVAANRTGLFLVRPEHLAVLGQASPSEIRYRSTVFALAAAALAAPLLWFAHSLL
jgi:hypothetical protein